MRWGIVVTGQIPVPVLEKRMDRQNQELAEEQQQLESVLLQADSLVLMQKRLAFMAIPFPSPPFSSSYLPSLLPSPVLSLPFSHKPDKPHSKGRRHAREKHFIWSKVSMRWDQGEVFTALPRPGDGVEPCGDEAGHEGSDGLQQADAGNAVRHSSILVTGRGRRKGLDLLYIAAHVEETEQS